jgi:oligopeptide transport system substrate-binding protein
MYNGRAVPAQTVIPPGLGGYDPKYKNPYAKNDPEAAKALIAKAGYKYVDGKAIGKDGKQLSLSYESSGNDTLSREWAEFYQKYLADVGIKTDIVLQDWPTFLSKVDNHQAQFGGMGWGADYPDAQNFLQLLYGENKAPGPNASNYDNPKFNELYEKVSVMQQSAERDKLYTQLSQIAVEDAAMIVKTHRSSYALLNPWAKNRFFRDIGQGYSKYYNVDNSKK